MQMQSCVQHFDRIMRANFAFKHFAISFVQCRPPVCPVDARLGSDFCSCVCSPGWSTVWPQELDNIIWCTEYDYERSTRGVHVHCLARLRYACLFQHQSHNAQYITPAVPKKDSLWTKMKDTAQWWASILGVGGCLFVLFACCWCFRTCCCSKCCNVLCCCCHD